MKRDLIVGVDIGGSHISVGIVDLSTRSFIEGSYIRKEINPHGTVEEIIKGWKTTILSIEGFGSKLARIAIAMPGPFDYKNGISLIKSQDKFEALYGLNVKKLLAEALKIEEANIYFENDAACFLQGEMYCGAGMGVKTAIGLTLGTGLGSARYSKGLAEDAALWSSPFRGTIAEEYISSRWFVRSYKEETGESIEDVKTLYSLTLCCDLAKQLFIEFGDNLAAFLSPFIFEEKPDMVLLGGNITKASELFLPTLTLKLDTQGLTVPVKTALLEERGALIGAASGWKKR